MKMRVCLTAVLLASAGFCADTSKIKDWLDPIILPPIDQAKLLPSRLSFATFGTQNTFIATEQVITDHLNQKRYAPRSQMQSKMTAQNLALDDLLASASDKNMPKSCPPKGYVTGWLDAFGEYASEKLQLDVAAFRFHVGGAVAGVDYNCVNDDVLGFGAAYAFTHVEEDADAGDANINQGMFGFYSLLHADDWYFDLGLWSGYYHTSNSRNMPLDMGFFATECTTHGWQLVPHVEIGYEGYLTQVCREQWFGVGPFALADWVANWEDGFAEHGGNPFNMRIKGRFCSLLRAETGLRFHEIIKYGWGNLVFEEKGSYAYQKMFGTGTLTAGFIDIASPVGEFHTLQSGQNLGVAEFSVIFQPVNRKWPYGNIRYQGQFGSKFQTHQGIVEIGRDF